MTKRLFSFLLASILMTCTCLSAFAADSQGGAISNTLSAMFTMALLMFKALFLTRLLGMFLIRLLAIQSIAMV